MLDVARLCNRIGGIGDSNGAADLNISGHLLIFESQAVMLMDWERCLLACSVTKRPVQNQQSAIASQHGSKGSALFTSQLTFLRCEHRVFASDCDRDEAHAAHRDHVGCVAPWSLSRPQATPCAVATVA